MLQPKKPAAKKPAKTDKYKSLGGEIGRPPFTPAERKKMPKVGNMGSAKNGKSFPDLNKDGKITKADILKGRGVIAKKGMTIKKAQNGDKTKKTVPMSVAEKKVDSLDYDARARKQAAMNRTVGPKGYDDISKKLIEQANKSDSLKKVWKKNIDKVKVKKKMKSGGSMTKCKYGCK